MHEDKDDHFSYLTIPTIATHNDSLAYDLDTTGRARGNKALGGLVLPWIPNDTPNGNMAHIVSIHELHA